MSIEYPNGATKINFFTAGKQLHVQTSVGVANAANKLLFGFSNTTGATCYVTRMHATNTQTATISGVLCQLNVQTGSSIITGGTTINNASSPLLVAAYRDPSFTIPAGLTFNTNGTLGGTIRTLESVRWSTDELSANGNGLPHEILALGAYHDLFNFSEDPLVILNGYSCAIVTDAAATNGTTLVDFNIRFI